MNILVLNAGSSTLKFALFDDSARDEVVRGVVDWGGNRKTATLRVRLSETEETQDRTDVAGYADAVRWILHAVSDRGFHALVGLVGHRVVHGGTEFCQPVVIDDHVHETLKRVSRLAPLHNPPALETIAAARSALPDVPQVAVFDTAFFADLPARAFMYPVPLEWYERYGIRRFGFHGISHVYCAGRAAELMGRQDDPSLRLVICHLGNGCSATAVRGGDAVATTMGFTPLEGLMMGTRSGSIDPGILLYLLQQQGFDADQLEECLNRRAGLLGISGVSSDFREVEAAAADGNARARLAIDMFADRVRSAIGALAVSLGGLDGLVLTAGIGQHSASLRSEICDGLECLGLHLDTRRSEFARADADVSAADSPGRILVMRTREELMIARTALCLLGADGVQ